MKDDCGRASGAYASVQRYTIRVVVLRVPDGYRPDIELDGPFTSRLTPQHIGHEVVYAIEGAAVEAGFEAGRTWITPP